MRPPRASTWLAVAAMASAWVFPHGLDEGLYTVTMADDMTEEPEMVMRRDLGDYVGPGMEQPPPPESLDIPEPPPAGFDLPYKGKRPGKPPPRREHSWHHDLVPLPVSRHQCIFNAPGFRADEYAQARASLALYCDKYLVPKRTVHISVSRNGTVGTFMCNFSKRAQICSEREYAWAERHWLDMRCGPLRPGQIEMAPWLKWYGRAFPGMDLCPAFLPIKEQVWYGPPREEKCPDGCRKDRQEAVDEAFYDRNLSPPPPL